MSKNVEKTSKKYIKGLIISRKPGKKVCYRNVFYTIGFGTIFGSPAKFPGIVMSNRLVTLAWGGG
jgi:hypothetical protein